MKKKRRIIFPISVGALLLAMGVVAASPGVPEEPLDLSRVAVTINATPDYVVAEVTVDKTPVISGFWIEGQEYIVQEDGTITIFLK